MSQVLIVSTRLPVSVRKEDGQLSFYPSVGGLATGLASYVNGKKNSWVGWPGIASDELTDEDKQTIIIELAKHNCSPVFLSQRQLDEFYNGYSNDVLWPLFHNLPYKQSDKTVHDRRWRAYRSVNQHFAEAVLSLVRRDSRIWVHDYQLMLLPEMLRRELGDTSVGFFLHIPFPDSTTLSYLPEHRKLLQGILGADLVGFHTANYASDFLDNCLEANVGIVSDDVVVLGDHAVRVADFPMGIDYKRYASAGKSKAVKAAAKRYKKRYKGQKIIVAVDRMDPSKGLVERLQAYRQLLEQNPRLRGKVVFAMVAAPSRTDIAAYQKLAKQLDSLVAEINTSYGGAGWQPIDYMNTSQPFEEVTALFSVADVAFIAPLKDGMNLAAKEFVASKRKGGVLILSETAGAAEELQDALLVNPLSPAAVVDALQQGLDMPKRELRRRLKRMQKQLSTHTVHTWAASFVDSLQQPVLGTKPRAKTLKGPYTDQLLTDYTQSKKRLLLLDYDGTLVPFSSDYKAATPPQSVIRLLTSLAASKQNDVVLVSGRSATDLQPWFGNLHINLVGEHGAVVKKAGSAKWKTNERAESLWKKAIQPVLQKYAELTPGARVESKPHSLVWHYRSSPPYYAQKYAVIIKKILKPVVKTYGLQVFQGNKILEVKDPKINKGAAIQTWLHKPHDFVLAMGDDFTDEEMFIVLPPTSYGIKVGAGSTYAPYRLPDVKASHSLLRRLTKQF